MTLWLAILLLTYVSSYQANGTIATYVDAIELNHVYDCKAQHIYDQIIFWERSPTNGKMYVRAWCLADESQDGTGWANRRPCLNHTTGQYQVDWHDSDAKILRKITSGVLRESWTTNDPERDNQKILAVGLRFALPKLFKPEE